LYESSVLGVRMFDVEGFVAACREVLTETEPRLAVKEVLEAAVADPRAIAAALPPSRAEIVNLYAAPELTVLNVVWAPGMSFGPHDHRMRAAIGVYSGGEENRFFRRAEQSLTPSGEKDLRPRDVCLLGSDAVHAVTNPTSEYAGAIHVYGGDFFGTPRSEWRGDPLREEPYDVERVLASFEAANGPSPS
jgi:predicted metal-dependent enzyme (double-stranded beta helix superfamily)